MQTTLAAGCLTATYSIAAPAPAGAQGIENPTEEQLLATATLIAFPSRFRDTFNVDDPHMDGTAAKMYKFRGVAGDSVTISAGSLGLNLVLALADSSGTQFEMFDDDSGFGANATIDAQLPMDGTYFVLVLPSDQRAYGSFSLTVAEGARARAGRDEDDFATPLEASQKRWVPYGRSQSGWSYYDRDTRESTGNGVSVRTRLAFRELQDNARGEAYDSRLMQVEIRCAGQQSRLSDLVETRGGAVVDRVDITGEWTAIPPGSVMETLFEALCGG